MPSRTGPTKAPADSDSERLLDAVVILSQQASILIDLIEDVREDLSWLTRNGIPHQPLIVRVDRMARDPLALDWGERLKFSVLDASQKPAAASIDCSDSQVGALIDVLADPLGQVAPEKLATLISLFDFVRHEVLKAIRSTSAHTCGNPGPDSPSDTDQASGTNQPDRQERQSAPPGHLF